MKPFEPQYRRLGLEDFQWKPAPSPRQQSWHCLICGSLEFRWSLSGDMHDPDLCPTCLWRLGNGVITAPITAGLRGYDHGRDRAHVRALGAMLNALKQEITDGRFAH